MNLRKQQSKEQNQFKSNKSPNKSFKIEKQDFPILLNTRKEQETETETENILDYKNAINIKEEIVDNNIPNGWINYYYDDNKKIIKKYNENDNENNCKYEINVENEIETPEEYHNSVFNNIQLHIINKWEKYKFEYNKLHGDGEYEKIYNMLEYDYDKDSDSDYE